MQSNRHILYGMQVLVDQAWQREMAVVVESGVIKALIPADMRTHHLPATLHVYPDDHYLVPGFIDMHIHGAAGADVMDASEASLKCMAEALVKEGVTGFLATTMTADAKTLETVLASLSRYATAQSTAGATLLGIHLEGPYIAKEKAGAQLAGLCTTPQLSQFLHWQQLANDRIKVVTLAPELDGAIPFIQQLIKRGVIVSVGHTNATYDETLSAIEAGASQATHLFNAMRGMHQREPGAVGALLLSPRIYAEIIADHLHLHPAMLALARQVKGDHHLLLVTDAMRGKCMGEGRYRLGGQEVVVKGKQAVLADGTLAGSVLTMPEAIANVAALPDCSLTSAILMASTQPAEQLGLAHCKGRIAVGYDADLVILDAALSVQSTFRQGTCVYHV